MFELPHFATELLVVLPCVQILVGRLKVLAASQVIPHLPAGLAGLRLSRVLFAPNILRARWEPAPDQRRFAPRARANRRVMACIALICALAASNALLAPLRLEEAALGHPLRRAVAAGAKLPGNWSEGDTQGWRAQLNQQLAMAAAPSPFPGVPGPVVTVGLEEGSGKEREAELGASSGAGGIETMTLPPPSAAERAAGASPPAARSRWSAAVAAAAAGKLPWRVAAGEPAVAPVEAAAAVAAAAARPLGALLRAGALLRRGAMAVAHSFAQRGGGGDVGGDGLGRAASDQQGRQQQLQEYVGAPFMQEAGRSGVPLSEASELLAGNHRSLQQDNSVPSLGDHSGGVGWSEAAAARGLGAVSEVDAASWGELAKRLEAYEGGGKRCSNLGPLRRNMLRHNKELSRMEVRGVARARATWLHAGMSRSQQVESPSPNFQTLCSRPRLPHLHHSAHHNLLPSPLSTPLPPNPSLPRSPTTAPWLSLSRQPLPSCASPVSASSCWHPFMSPT